jgi:hypothetical protein
MSQFVPFETRRSRALHELARKERGPGAAERASFHKFLQVMALCLMSLIGGALLAWPAPPSLEVIEAEALACARASVARGMATDPDIAQCYWERGLDVPEVGR